ncbi:AAEL017487-PA [Aedes aegypti]|uniref:AAEL017487-PA n=1 Tax=Aedes aegypti TaxID=7159 RepID=J9E9K9_AEDAE|nr:AAEL017487-PA [Aedes aegypti]
MKTYGPQRTKDSQQPLHVEGFEFPLTQEYDIERLEVAISDDAIRDQYIRYLAAKKPPKKDLVECFSQFFADSAMVNFNWNGFSNHRFPKKAMRSYGVFTYCMLKAWSAEGLTENLLQIKLKRTVEKINNRRNVQHSKRRRKARLLNAEKNK